ncbi:hypothetical protein GOBAR_AA17416 [Gossypium barbadense]|uniref:Uncharacterized protein n=1 Tax=Gossypium barbadense TaxID=3634 RepID=A0A2P5XIR5_GOSBA|nr:hypothetical protein GOBAR_AA17416 [Gossypium barbadense]
MSGTAPHLTAAIMASRSWCMSRKHVSTLQGRLISTPMAHVRAQTWSSHWPSIMWADAVRSPEHVLHWAARTSRMLSA